jgi:hypothetical protein
VLSQTSLATLSAPDIESLNSLSGDLEEESDDEDCEADACESGKESDDSPMLTQETNLEDDGREISTDSVQSTANDANESHDQVSDLIFSQVGSDVFLNCEHECSQSIFFNQDNPEPQPWIFMREKDSSVFYIATADKQGECGSIFLAAPDCSNTDDEKKVIFGYELDNIEWTSTYSEQEHGWKF